MLAHLLRSADRSVWSVELLGALWSLQQVGPPSRAALTHALSCAHPPIHPPMHTLSHSHLLCASVELLGALWSLEKARLPSLLAHPPAHTVALTPSLPHPRTRHTPTHPHALTRARTQASTHALTHPRTHPSTPSHHTFPLTRKSRIRTPPSFTPFPFTPSGIRAVFHALLLPSLFIDLQLWPLPDSHHTIRTLSVYTIRPSGRFPRSPTLSSPTSSSTSSSGGARKPTLCQVSF